MNTCRVKKGSAFLVAVFCLFLMTGCSATSVLSGKPDMSPPLSTGEIPSPSSIVRYFNDIELPSDLKFNQKKSRSVQTDSFRGGVLYYNGRVEVESLKNFIIGSMKRNQWKLLSEMSYGNTLLAFVKPNKTCMVSITESFGRFGDTEVALYVTASVQNSEKYSY